jgi:hypothetical protein
LLIKSLALGSGGDTHRLKRILEARRLHIPARSTLPSVKDLDGQLEVALASSSEAADPFET